MDDTTDRFSPMPDGPIPIELAFTLARALLAYEQGKSDGFMFLPPLAWLLYRMNAPGVSPADRDLAARAALPYCHEKVPEPPAFIPDPEFDFGALNSAKQILAAQKKVMRSLGDGRINSMTAQRYIAMLDALRRSHESTVTEDRLLDYEETRKSVEADLDRRPS